MSTLARDLERNAVVGRIITPVHDVWWKIRRLAAGDAKVTFGLEHLLPTSVDEVMDALRRLSRWEFPAETDSHWERSWVDGGALAENAERAAVRLREACERGERVLFGTGHPAGPVMFYSELARTMSQKGADVLRVAEGEPFDYPSLGRVHVRYVGDVACISDGGELLHTHSPVPMHYLLDTGPMPDLVVGDHGFAGVGLARGADAVAVVDTNDPALVLAWARGLPIVPILCDDNRPPSSYEPLTSFILERL